MAKIIKNNKIINEDFFDEEGIEKQLSDGTEDELEVYRRGKGLFKFRFKTEFTGINDHWRGNDECYYPVKKVYDRICEVLDRSGLLAGDVIVALPHVSDDNNKIEEFDVTEKQMHEGEIEVNSLYGYNEISNDTVFTYDIYFDKMIRCSFQSFCYRLERMIAGLGKAIKVLPRDKGELIFYKLDKETREYKTVYPASSLYTSLSTTPTKTYVAIYRECVDPTQDLKSKEDDKFIEDVRLDVDLDAIARTAIRRAVENCELHPEIKLLYTVNVPYVQSLRQRWNSGKPCSFIVMDLKFPEKEVD